MTYAIPKVRSNYGTFNIRFQGAKVWNDISNDIKLLPLKIFKKNLKLLKFFLKNTNNYSSSLTLFFTLIFLAFLTLLVLCVSVVCNCLVLYLAQTIILDESPQYSCPFF